MPFVNIVETIIFWVVWLKYYLNPDEGPYYGTWYTYWRFKDKFFSRKKSKEIQQWQKVNKGIVGAVLIILLQIQSAG